MRRGAIVAMLAAVSACTALLDLQDPRFDAEPIDGGSIDGSTDGGGDGDGDASDDGSTFVDIPVDANSTPCQATPGEGDGSVSTSAFCPDAGMVDLTSNAQHCGACFHDCGTKTCTAGVCGAETVHAESTHSSVLGNAGTHVGWGTYPIGNPVGTLAVAEIDGGDYRLLGTMDGGVAGFDHGGVGDDFLLVTGQGIPSTVFLFDGGSFTVGANATERKVIVRGNEAFSDVYGSEIRKIAIVPGGGPTTLKKGIVSLLDLEVAGSYVYWTAATPKPDGGPNPPGVQRIHIQSQVINDSKWTGRSWGVGVDGAYVYVFEHATQRLLRLPFDLQGDPEELAHWTGTSWDAANSIVLDGDFIYVNPHRGGTSGAIMRVPRCGGAPVILQTMSTRGRVVVAGDWVFWGQETTGGVRRIRK
jgi:hypothetical protein